MDFKRTIEGAQSVNEKSIIHRDFLQVVVASAGACMAGVIIGVKEEQVVIGLHFAQFGRELGRLPIGDAWVVESGGGVMVLCGFAAGGGVGGGEEKRIKRSCSRPWGPPLPPRLRVLSGMNGAT